MIISKTPLRISFVGGGSDIIDNHNKVGSVISVTINKFVYVLLKKKFNDTYRLSYSKTENVKNVNKIKHNLIRNCIKYSKIKNGLEIVTVADIPSSGSGLGSSSALTVGLLNCISKYNNKLKSANELALESYKIEKKIMKQTLGYQDHANASIGGFNQYFFKKNYINKTPINLSDDFIKYFQKHILIFHTGVGRNADKILKKIKKPKNTIIFSELQNLTTSFRKSLKKENIIDAAKIIDYNWYLKKKLDNSVYSDHINNIYQTAKKNGALSGKILGAGGGGHIMFIAEPKFHKKIMFSLKKLKRLEFEFEKNGTKIIYSDIKSNQNYYQS
tara:strand:+ start:93 stop:1082 length:990 start_codon:yes stop_codon:yes gene_type:complete